MQSNNKGVGMIIPPKNVINIIDATAAFFVKQNEDVTLEKKLLKQDAIKFGFVKPDHAYYAYFRLAVQACKEGKSKNCLLVVFM